MEIFYEKAFWGFLALVVALIAVIYALFKGGFNKDIIISNSKLEEKLTKKFNEDYLSRIRDLEISFNEFKVELESFKRHEDNNSKIQIALTKKLLKKMDKLDDIDPNLLTNILEGD